MITDLSRVRNIGISAHIDSGKTTLTERILFYTQRIHAIHEVKGKDGVGAKMDSMELERERGITIQSAATHCEWKKNHINIIDTPGHVDFTVEVERSLRVLDGAILVLCSVAGVQSQSITVDRQMRRYNVPRLAFVNKCDRSGANPFRVAQQLREKLGHNSVMVQIPIGLEDKHDGIVDLVTMKAVYFHGPNGQDIEETEIPASLAAQAQEYREKLLDAASMFDDELMEAILEERVTPEQLKAAIRKGCISMQLTPVFCGSAYKNRGVQKLLDGVLDYLPDPNQVKNNAVDLDHNEAKVELTSDPAAPLVSLAFKLEDGRYGQLTYIRIYQGTLARGTMIYNTRTGKKVKVGRLVRMHSDEMEDIESACGGDLVALFGVDCASGDTFTDGTVNWAMSSMYVPEPVIRLMIKPVDSKSQINMSKAIHRFTREDPTFRSFVDPESGETIICGMGELHLDVYVERMRREYQCQVETGAPQVAYRETVSKKALFDYVHKKQTGGSGQYGKVQGWIEPWSEADYEFESQVVGGTIPKEFISSCDKGFRSMLEKGMLIGFPVVNLKCVVNDGAYHAVDSSDIAFQEAARGAFRQAYPQARPIIMEPVMKVAVEGPTEFQGGIVRTLMQRRGMIVGTTEQDGFAAIEAEVPLAEMFGYSTDLRSATQGKAEFTMEFARYAPVPTEIAEELRKKYAEQSRM
jgi:elongation factor G